mgnify:CR=1 FL=1
MVKKKSLLKWIIFLSIIILSMITLWFIGYNNDYPFLLGWSQEIGGASAILLIIAIYLHKRG